MRRFAIAILAMSVTQVACAWSEAGHKIIASIAFRQLTPEQQATIAAILKHHPRFAEDFQSKMPEDLKTEAEQSSTND